MLKKIFLVAAVFLLFFFSSSPAWSEVEVVQILDISFESSAVSDRIIIQTSSRVEPKVARLHQPERLIFDFPNAALIYVPQGREIESPRLEAIRSGQFSTTPYITRIVLDLKQDTNYKVLSKDDEIVILLGQASPAKVKSKPRSKSRDKPLPLPLVEESREEWLARKLGEPVARKKKVAKISPPVKKMEIPLISVGVVDPKKIRPIRKLELPPLYKIGRFKIVILGKKLPSTATPVFIGENLMLPAKDLLDLLGFTRIFEPKTKTLRAKRREIELVFQVGKKKMKLNRRAKDLHAPPMIINNRIYLPLVSMAKWLNYGLKWDSAAWALFISPRIIGIRYGEIEGVEQIILQGSAILPEGKVKELSHPPRLVLDIPGAILELGGKKGITFSQKDRYWHLPIKSEEIADIRIREFKSNQVRLVIEQKEIPPYYLGRVNAKKRMHLLFPAVITAVTTEATDGEIRVKVSSSRAMTFKAQSLTNPDRLIIDFPHTLFRAQGLLEVGKGLVERTRVSQFKVRPLITRLVVDLQAPAEYETSATPDGKEITIIVGAPRERIERKVVVKVDVLKGKTIVIDPGHGGMDPGAFGPMGTLEKEVNLSTALKLGKLLSEAGAKVLLTREKDQDMNLKEVVDFANRSYADIFISLHYNAFIKSSISGTETYWWTKKSKPLAEIIHRHMLKKLGRNNRGVKKVQFYAIHHTTMPAVLPEPAYITNREEEKLVRQKWFHQEAAEAIFEGIKEYFSRYE